ncbi:hypothetical protein CCP4SC76_5580016 [Gammaproteobacteria bacterium]
MPGDQEGSLTAFKKFYDFVELHFKHEEAFMLSYDYPQKVHHMQQHVHAISDLKSISITMDDITFPDAQKIVDFLESWFYNHVIHDDVPLGDFMLEKRRTDHINT